jgi:23S rRNA pseudouridine2605 synthase
MDQTPLFPLEPVVCYHGVMREDPGKNHPRRGPAARLSAHAPARQNRFKKPPRGAAKSKPSAAPRAHGSPTAAEHTGERIAKVMARAGLCSRREAECWIGEGRVALNGVALTNPAVNVAREDKITVDGLPLAHRDRTRLFLFHKPRGLVATARDPQGRPTIFDYLRQHWPDGPRLVSIGRLDINSEGLLLLTNDGGLARVLELPATGWVRRYRVRAKGETDQATLDQLGEGLTLEGVKYAGIEATLDRVQGANSWLTMALREGKNREIKRLLEHVGLQVNRLIRLSFGPFQLGELAAGAVEEVRTRVLRDQLGPMLAKAAGADFSSPVHAENEAAKGVDVLAREPRKSSAGLGRDHGNAPHGTRSPRASTQRGNDRQPEARVEAKVKPRPPSRKHVTAMRAEYREPPKERKRIERHATVDRGGRTVYVERLVSAKRGDKRQDKRKPQDSGVGRRFDAGRRDRNDLTERPARRTGGPEPSFKPTKERTTTTRQERWQKLPRAQKNSASGDPNANTDRMQRRAQPYREFADEDGRRMGQRMGGNPENRLPRSGGQAPKRCHGSRSRKPCETPGGGRPAGGAKPIGGGGPRRRGGPPTTGRPSGKS